MGETVRCDGCGKTLCLDVVSDEIYCVSGKCYCYECALKLPKYIMKKCNQCKYLSIDDSGVGFCQQTKKYVGRYDDACKHYQSKFLTKTNL